jgi:exo-1,4-beta-D-glucosaminidase
MTELQKLQPAKLRVSANAVRRGTEEQAHVTVSNPSPNLAFFIHLQIKQGSSGRNVLPVIWQDNYFSLLPGESREVTGAFKIKDAPGSASVAVEGWNSEPLLVPLTRRR